ncbi:MAG TPA: undecaprenyldiphospho-muramoylpentapeptide beta-N-acetylglucosaminyltransferase [bacterium]|nr:undecaprenyldiphospho-muramoylpentapeptide beta-N-acetylglucosaminyltransferase [bacterium]
MRVIFACGGTGGHIYPAIAVADLLKRGAGVKVLFAGSSGGMEEKIAGRAGYKFKGVDAKPLLRRFSAKNAGNIYSSLKAVAQSAGIIKEFRPCVVMGTGGFASFPVVAAAVLEGKRTVIHEPNMKPGAANRLLAGFVSAITVGFEETAVYFPKSRVCVTGNPVRSSIGAVSRSAAAGRMGVNPLRKTLLVMPGSRAAHSINEVLLAALPYIYAKVKGLQVLWMSGDADYGRVKKGAASYRGIRVFRFIKRAEDAYAASDAGILRAGAATLSEITAAKLPCVLVPYPHATGNHQEKNAEVFEKREAAVVIKDKDMTKENLAETVTAVLSSARSRKMRAALGKMHKPGSAERIAAIITGEAAK